VKDNTNPVYLLKENGKKASASLRRTFSAANFSIDLDTDAADHHRLASIPTRQRQRSSARRGLPDD
jgi:hypothetical protein